jgi:periplasmic protein TonB
MSQALRWLLRALLLFPVFLVVRSFAAEPVLNGISIYTELGSEQFVAGLYTSKTSADSKAILLDESDQRIEVRVLADSLLGNRFKRQWIEGVAINAGNGEMAKNSQYLADFSNLLALKLQRDDILSIARQGNNTVVRVNNLELGRIPSGGFYNLLLRTWIGPVPLSSTFRDGLLAAGKIDEKNISIYSKINPTPERIAVIRGAILASAKTKGKPLEIAAEKPEPITKPVPPVKPESPVKEITKNEAAKPIVEKLPKAEPAEHTATTVPPAVAAATPVAKANIPAATPPKPVNKASEVFEENNKQETADSLLVQQLYIAKLSKRTAGYVKYPKSALSKEQEGTVRLSVTINRSGQVVNVTSSSANEVAVLTEAAVAAARKASPYPAIPEQIKSDSFTFTIPVTFRVTDK